MKHRLKTLGFVAALMGAQLPAFAAHPYITDDTGTIGANHWQLELLAENGEHSNTVAGVTQKDTYTLFTPVLTRALADNLDVALGLSHLNMGDGNSGMGDSALEFKWRFYEQGNWSMGLKPGIYFATGDETKGLGNGGTGYGLNFIVSKEMGRTRLHGNIAYNHNNYASALQDANRSDLWRVSAGFCYMLTDTFNLAGEAGANTNQIINDDFYPGNVAGLGMLGMVYSPNSEMDFSLGMRKGLNKAYFDSIYLLGATLRW